MVGSRIGGGGCVELGGVVGRGMGEWGIKKGSKAGKAGLRWMCERR